MKSIQPVWIVLVGMLLSGTALAQGSDQVMKKDGSSVRGEVYKVTLKAVHLKADGDVEKTISWNEVDRVIYTDFTKALSEAKRGLREQQPAVAIQYGKIAREQLDSGKIRSLHRPAVMHYLSRGYFLNGSFEKAIKTSSSMLSSSVNHKFVFPLVRTLVLSRVYSSMDLDLKEKREAYDKIMDTLKLYKDKAKERGGSERLMSRFQLLEAQALEEIGYPGQAKNFYEDLVGSEFPDVDKQAKVGQWRCSVRAEEDVEEAREELEELKDEYNNDPFVVSGYLNAKGSDLLADWTKNKKKTKKLRQALFAFLRSSTLQFPGIDDPAIEHRRALKLASDAYVKLSENGSKQSKDYFADQAQKTMNELIELYPSTPESIRAKKKVKEPEN